VDGGLAVDVVKAMRLKAQGYGGNKYVVQACTRRRNRRVHQFEAGSNRILPVEAFTIKERPNQPPVSLEV